MHLSHCCFPLCLSPSSKKSKEKCPRLRINKYIYFPRFGSADKRNAELLSLGSFHPEGKDLCLVGELLQESYVLFAVLL